MTAAQADALVDGFVEACRVRGTAAECACLGPQLDAAARQSAPGLRDFSIAYLTGVVTLGNRGIAGDAPEARALLAETTAAYGVGDEAQRALLTALGVMQGAAAACSAD